MICDKTSFFFGFFQKWTFKDYLLFFQMVQEPKIKSWFFIEKIPQCRICNWPQSNKLRKQTPKKKLNRSSCKNITLFCLGANFDWWFCFSLCGRISLWGLNLFREAKLFWNLVAIQLSILSQPSTKVDGSNSVRFNSHCLGFSRPHEDDLLTSIHVIVGECAQANFVL